MLGIQARLVAVLLAMFAFASPVSAQHPVSFSLNGGVFSTSLNTEGSTGKRHLSGFSAGGGAAVGYGRLGFGVQYLEGSLTPSGGGTDRDIVEGEAMLSVRALSWLSLKLGPHIRSFLIGDGTQRWVFWEGRVRTKARLGTDRLTSILEFWQVLSADVNTVESFDGGQGIEGSLKWELANLPLWLGLGYRIDRSHLGDGSRTEVVEHFLFTVGIRRGQVN